METWRPYSSLSQSYPLWDAATPSKPFREPQFLEVDLGHVQPEGATTTIQASISTPALTHSLADTI